MNLTRIRIGDDPKNWVEYDLHGTVHITITNGRIMEARRGRDPVPCEPGDLTRAHLAQQSTPVRAFCAKCHRACEPTWHDATTPDRRAKAAAAASWRKIDDHDRYWCPNLTEHLHYWCPCGYSWTRRVE